VVPSSSVTARNVWKIIYLELIGLEAVRKEMGEGNAPFQEIPVH